jgi:hypothetical protein
LSLAVAGASLAGGLVVAAAAAAVGACTSNPAASGFTPITGIIIRSDSLVAGKGCGTAPGQVYRYLAMVSYAPDDAGTSKAPIAGAVYDCFADGWFSNLQPDPTTGSVSYVVTIYAYDAPSYRAADLQCYVDQTCATQSPDACSAARLHTVYTTTCTATQQQGISVLADCRSLARFTCDPNAGASKIAIPTASFRLIDGGTIACGEDAGYTQAVAFYAPEGGLPTQTGVFDCGAPLVIDPAQPCTSYAIQLHLQSTSEAGPAVVASTQCSATTRPTCAATASCSPASHP